ncbi:MAG TPA: FHA domain-containing protein [Streptosporangiaceae bacterium]|nr:FHA domain-containing protein [Streptosporangiaceae bacterium]
MSEDREAAPQSARRPPRTPVRQRSRRRWAIAGGVAASWVVLEVLTGSAVSATVALVVIATLAAVTVGGLRALGITREHPWIQRAASRPWRDGEDVLRVAMRHLHDVFVITPSGSLLAPGLVELQLNPDDLATLCERMELGVISESMSEVYEEQVTAYRARLTGAGRPSVYVTASGSVPPGRYRLRQGDPVGAQQPEFAYAAAQPAFAGPGGTWYEQVPAVNERGPAAGGGMTTIMAEGLPPALRLVTGSSVAETRVSGARAGRGPVELMLPDVPTVSREHAKFTFADGRWWITNQGRNGLTLNGSPVAGEQPLENGDTIRWGTTSDALQSRVEIS